MGAGKEGGEGKIKQGDLAPMVGIPGRGRAATLVLMGGMVAHNAARAPGQMNPNQIVGRGRGLADLNNSYPTSRMGRARVRNLGPHLPEPLLCFPYTWPQCLCRDTLDTPPSPPNSDSDTTSRPPSLESITDTKSP